MIHIPSLIEDAKEGLIQGNNKVAERIVELLRGTDSSYHDFNYELEKGKLSNYNIKLIVHYLLKDGTSHESLIKYLGETQIDEENAKNIIYKAKESYVKMMNKTIEDKQKEIEELCDKVNKIFTEKLGGDHNFSIITEKGINSNIDHIATINQLCGDNIRYIKVENENGKIKFTPNADEIKNVRFGYTQEDFNSESYEK